MEGAVAETTEWEREEAREVYRAAAWDMAARERRRDFGTWAC